MPALSPVTDGGPQSGFRALMQHPGFGSALRNIGLGILANPGDPFSGLARGLQAFQQQSYQEEQDDLAQKYRDRQMQQQQAELEDAKQDRALNRADAKAKFLYQQDQDKIEQENWQRNFEQEGSQFNENLAIRRAELKRQGANDGLQSQLLRSQIAENEAQTDKYRSTIQATDAKGNTIEVPKAVVSKGYTNYTEDAARYKAAVQQNDDLERLVQLSPTIGAGPELWNAGVRGLARYAGIEIGGAETDAISEADRITAQGALDKVITDMAKQGQVTESERDQAKQAIADPTKMSPDVLVKVARAFQQRNSDFIGDVEGWGDRQDYQNYPSYRIQQQGGRRKTKSAPVSGVTAPDGSAKPVNKTSSGITWSIED